MAFEDDIRNVGYNVAIREFYKIEQDLITKHRELGMEASGKWINSLEVIRTDGAVKLIGEKYTEQLVYGRRPGKMPPVRAIEQWIRDKGLVNNLRSNQTVTSFAWAIAKKMAKEGSKYYREGGTDLVSAVITPERMQKIINIVGNEVALSIVPIFRNNLKQIAV